MTDSTKRFLFGNSNVNINLKINIHSSIQYSDKSLDNSKKNVVEHQNLILPKRGNSIDKVTQSPKTNSIKSNKNIINNMNHTTSNSNVENPIFSKVKRPLTSIHKKLRNSSASPQQRKNNLKFPSKKTNNKDLSCDKKSNFIDKEENPDNDINDNSFIDFDIEKEEKKIDKDFTEFIKLFKENYPLSKLDNLTDVNEMVKYTKDIISQLLSYQKMYFDRINNAINKNHKLKNLLIKYNEIYRNIKKKNNRLNEKIDNYEFKNYINVNVNKKENSNMKEKNIPSKNNEIGLFKDFFELFFDKTNDEEEKKNDNTNINENDKNLLIKTLQGIINKKGPLNKILNEKNSTEEERKLSNEIIKKYNLKITKNKTNENEKENVKVKEKNFEEKKNSEEKKTKHFEYIITNKPDENDNKLEQYLINYYSKKNIPKIPFKKISMNNYEYGTLKVMIKFDNESIRIRYLGKYSLLDNFLETNAHIENKKKKNNISGKKKSTPK